MPRAISWALGGSSSGSCSRDGRDITPLTNEGPVRAEPHQRGTFLQPMESSNAGERLGADVDRAGDQPFAVMHVRQAEGAHTPSITEEARQPERVHQRGDL